MSNNEKLISLCLFLKILSSLFILWRKLLGDKSIGLGAIGLKQMAKFKIQSIFCQLRLQVTTWGRVISLKPLLCAIIIIVWNNYHHYCVKQKSQKGKVTKLSDPRCWKFLDDVQFSYLPYPQTSHSRKILEDDKSQQDLVGTLDCWCQSPQIVIHPWMSAPWSAQSKIRILKPLRQIFGYLEQTSDFNHADLSSVLLKIQP